MKNAGGTHGQTGITVHLPRLETGPFHGKGSVDGNDGWKGQEGQILQELLEMVEGCHRQARCSFCLDDARQGRVEGYDQGYY